MDAEQSTEGMNAISIDLCAYCEISCDL